MTFNDYQEETNKTAIYPDKGNNVVYPILGLAGETGEVADKVKKVYRDNQGAFSPEKKAEIAKEIGDVLWYVAVLSHDIGYDLSEIAQMNIDKLASRKMRNKINGDGDNR